MSDSVCFGEKVYVYGNKWHFNYKLHSVLVGVAFNFFIVTIKVKRIFNCCFATFARLT